MTRILVGLLVIFFISGQTTAQELEIGYELIQKIYEWGVKIYDKINGYQNPDKTGQNIEALMEQVEEVSSKLDNLENHLDMKLDSMLSILLADIKLETSLNQLKGILRHSFSKIDRFFDSSRQYKLGGEFGNQTLKDYAHKALWSTDSVPDLLNNLHEAFLPGGVAVSGFLSVMNQRAVLNVLHDCDTGVSPHQHVYYIYIQLLIAEVKGLMVQQQSLILQRWFDEASYGYMAEMNNAKKKFLTRLRDYTSLFSREIAQFPRQIRRCEVSAPRRGVHVFEILRFSRISIVDVEKQHNYCRWCPVGSSLTALSLQTNTTITDCKDMGSTMRACPAESGSPHEYVWFEDEAGTHYGPNIPCANAKTIERGRKKFKSMGRWATWVNCRVCACSFETNYIQDNYESTIWRISVTDQISDIWNNKVVTGVKLVTHDNALHLQIQQAQFTHSGMIYNHSNWKELDLGVFNDGMRHVKRPMVYKPFRHDRNSLYLDDIKVPDGYAVTGVRFKLVDDVGFKLQIFVSQFDLTSGNLSAFGSQWIDASNHPLRSDDYKRQRVEINMGASNDPTRASEFKYEIESNKLIKFTHTDLHKDAGQTTIPLLDAQSVETRPPFPLSGVGLSFKGRDGFGGYIAPRIYTLDVTKHVKMPKIREPNTPTTDTTETKRVRKRSTIDRPCRALYRS